MNQTSAVGAREISDGLISAPFHGRFVFDPLAHWARLTPERPALVGTGVGWTYEEFEWRTNRLSRVLRSRGIHRGDRVAFVLPRGADTVLLIVAILKAGAAYVPIASDSPPTRIAGCLEDARPALLVAEASHAVLPEGELECAELGELLKELEAFPPEPLDAAEIGLQETDLAYIIFTSGTTGRPKGVPISHRSLSNFIEGNQEACIRVSPDDRVFQGFSPASDGHHEEVWPTLSAGATLVVPTNAEVYSGDELGSFLRRHHVSVVSCAPTLLSTVEEDVPSLRRILFGAENCPMSLVRRWWRPDREILNTYGPTEATVGATFSVCHPDRPITIGRPLPNYFCYVVDEALNEVPEGELAIAGVGVAEGYFASPEASAAKFLPNPHAVPGQNNETLYRTGDRVRRDPDGNLVWLGRIDGQVKIRGHRIEVTEVEEQILAQPSIQSVAVVARQVGEHEAQLAALIVARDPETINLSDLLEGLREGLPPHMIPPTFEIVDRIPILPSGKIDRRACQSLHGHQLRVERELVPPRTETERMVLALWQRLFGTDDLSCADDFFTDLGGYSLLASRFISAIRNEEGFAGVSVLEIYEHPTVRSFAAWLDGQSRSGADAAAPTPEFDPVPPGRYRVAKVVQGLGVLVLYGIQGVFWLGPILGAIYYSNVGISDLRSLLLGLVLHAVSIPLLLLLAVATKWIVGGRFREGSYPVWGGTFLRWWFVHRMLAIAPTAFLTGTPLAGLYLRMLGAKVGRNVTFESLDVDCPDLIQIGDDCSFENSSWIRASEVVHGRLVIRPIRVESGCVVGVRSGVAGGAAMETGSALQDLSCAVAGTTVAAGEEWSGSPARRSDAPRLPKYEPDAQPSRKRLAVFGAAQAGLLVVLSILDSLPFMAVAFTLYNTCDGLRDYVVEPLFALALVAIACFQAVVVKWAVIGRLKEGTFAQPSLYWLRKWFADKHLETMTPTIVPIYDSLFARPLVRALGMKCGPRCEIALPRRLPYDLVEMGEESFLASEVSVGMPVRRNGRLTLERTVVGKRAFLGNDSVVPQGARFPDESLLGVLSICPPNGELGSATDQAWLGSPAFRMPNRQVHAQFDEQRTYRPTKRLYAERIAHETLRIVLPSLASLAVLSVLVEGFVAIWNDASLPVAIGAIPILYLFGALLGALICRGAKALLVGRYQPTIQPLWSRFVWKVETYSAVLHDFGVPMFIVPLVGTPFLGGLMRFLGAKIGQRVFINSTDFTETDLIHLGDDVSINENAPLQAHLFEDRVMKIGPIRVGDRCSVGNFSVVLCDSELKNDAHVGHLSLVMKGETIPSNTFWAGCPAQAYVETAPTSVE
jgi:non-ribosomal peptide synthetase-like protein